MLTVFFPSRNVFGLDALPKGQKYNHDYIAQNVIPELQCERSQFGRHKPLVKFAAQMDNSMRHNGTKATNGLKKQKISRLYSVYSQDLSLRDFWLFRMLKHQMTDRKLQSPKEMLDMLTELWDEVSFEEGRNGFLVWMERL